MTVFIREAEALLVQVPLRQRVDHALRSRQANATVFLVLTADDGTRGIGEALAREYVTGETAQECMEALGSFAHRLREPVTDCNALLQILTQEALDRQGGWAALCALDLALFDLWGKQTGRPAAELLDGNVVDRARTIQFSAVYPFATGFKLRALNLLYRTWLRATRIKIKTTGEIQRDLDYIERIAGAFPYPVDLRVDCNGALDPANAGDYLERLRDAPFGVRWVEQPFPKQDWESHARFQERFPELVLCADESVCTPKELERAASQRAFRAVNIRVSKNGGLRNAHAMLRRATALGLEVQIGCMVGETTVLASAGVHLAAAAGPVRYAEGCFGRILLKWDSVKPTLAMERGCEVRLRRLPAAGLVHDFDIRRLRRRAARRIMLDL